MLVTAAVLIGIGYTNFSSKPKGMDSNTLAVSSTNNLGDVQLVSSSAAIVENNNTISSNLISNSNIISQNLVSNSNITSQNLISNNNITSSNDNTNSISSASTETAIVENDNSNNNANNNYNTDNKTHNKASNNDNVNNDNLNSKKSSNQIQSSTLTESTLSTSSTLKNTSFSELKIERDEMYSKSLETYQKIVDSEEISSDQKSIAVQEIQKITELRNSIKVAEELIKLKGFDDVVIYSSNEQTSVIVRIAALSDSQVSQIQNIISKELGTEISNITISNK